MEFETLYKQTFAQVRCPAHVAVAAQPAPRRRFGWVICLAAPLLLAAGVLARVKFTNLHNTPHPSYAPDAVGGYALHYTLTTHPLDTLGEAVQTLAAEERQPAFQRMRTPDHYSFSQMVMTLGNSDLLIHYPNDIEKAEVFTDAADSLQDAAELTNLPLLRNDFLDACCMDGRFDLEPATRYMSDSLGYAALNEENPYPATRDQIETMAKEAGVELHKEQRHTDPPDEEAKAYLSDLLEQIDDLCAERQGLLDQQKLCEDGIAQYSHFLNLKVNVDEILDCQGRGIRRRPARLCPRCGARHDPSHRRHTGV